MAIRLVAQQEGYANKHPDKIVGNTIVTWKQGRIAPGEVFDFHPSFDVSDLSEEEVYALLPMWADPLDDHVWEAVDGLRRNPDRMQELRSGVTKKLANTGGSMVFNPYAAHRDPEAAASRRRKAIQEAKGAIEAKEAEDRGEADARENDPAAALDRALSNVRPGPKLPEQGVFEVEGKKDMYRVVVGTEELTVRGKKNAEDTLASMEQAQSAPKRMADEEPS